MVDLGKKTWYLGHRERVEVRLFDVRSSGTVTVTATILIKDSAGATTLAATAMTIDATDTKRPVAWYHLTTGAAQTITAAGTYSVFVTSTISLSPNDQVLIGKGLLEVKALS